MQKKAPNCGRAAQFGASPCSGLSFFIRINHNSFAFGVIFPVETEAKLLIKLDRVTVILIYTEVYGIARILHVQFGKQGKHLSLIHICNFCERLSVLCGGIDLIDARALKRFLPGGALPAQSEEGMREELLPGREKICAALKAANGNKTAAAQMLGISRVTLWRQLKKMEQEN